MHVNDKVVCLAAFPPSYREHFSSLPQVGQTYCVRAVKMGDTCLGVCLVGIEGKPHAALGEWVFPALAFRRVGVPVQSGLS